VEPADLFADVGPRGMIQFVPENWGWVRGGGSSREVFVGNDEEPTGGVCNVSELERDRRLGEWVRLFPMRAGE